MLIDPDTLEYKWFNERDIEVPLLLNLVERFKPRLFLDVGAYYSWFTYGADIKPRLADDCVYDGCDILPRPQEDIYVDHWFHNNVTKIGNVSYDFVSCVSAIEHCGITTYQMKDVEDEQYRVYMKMLNIATKQLFITCPYGLPGRFEGQYQNITTEQFELWWLAADAAGFKVEPQFFYNEFPQGRKKWTTISREEASRVPLDLTKGVQCMMAYLAHREQQ